MSICGGAKIHAELLLIEMDDIVKGLIDMVVKHGVTKLVMGAAADKHYSKKMTKPKSRTARTVIKEALPSCNIWFICKGDLICTREDCQDECWSQMSSPNRYIQIKPSEFTSQTSELSDRIHGFPTMTVTVSSKSIEGETVSSLSEVEPGRMMVECTGE